MNEEIITKAREKVIEGLFFEIEPYIIQIYRKESDIEPINISPLDSGVLLQINENYYLCTAAHTYYKEEVGNIGTFIGEDFYVLQGELSLLPIDASRENDKADIAVCKLTNEVVEDLKIKYKFLPLERVCINHKLQEENRYFMLGYPVTKTKKNVSTKTIKVKPFKFVTKGIISSNRYEKIGCDFLVNYLIDFHRYKVTNLKSKRKLTAPKPEGNSGTGLWFFNGKELVLVGIMIEYDNKESVFIGTRIDLVTELIRIRFDSTIPQSTVIKPQFSK